MMNLASRIIAGSTRLITAGIGPTSLIHTVNRNFHMLMRSTIISQPVSALVGLSAPAAATQGAIVGNVQRILAPFNLMVTQTAGFKVKGRLKRRCKDCYMVIRQQRRYIICPTHPRHKQMEMKKREYKTWILTHATQSKVRPY